MRRTFRVGDMLANSDEYHEADEWIGSVINQLDLTHSYSVREFLHLLGRELAEIAHEDGLLTAAYKSRIPVFCPDVGRPDGRRHRPGPFRKKIQLTFDMTQDTMDMMQIAQKTRNSGVITLGSTSSQNMLNLTEMSSYITRTTVPATNTLSRSRRIRYRSTCERLRSGASHGFRKVESGATTAFVPADPSIALPMIITALSQTAAKFMKGRKRPEVLLSRIKNWESKSLKLVPSSKFQVPSQKMRN